jgi:hypothetical protein
MKLANRTARLGIKKFIPSILLLNPEKNILNSNFCKRPLINPANTTGAPLCAQKN